MQEEQKFEAPKNAKKNSRLSLNYKYVSIALVVVLLLVVALWRPWVRAATAATRTVEVTGEATVKSTPDQFVFYPTYTAKSTDSKAALEELSKKSDEVVAKLKSLGVSENNIKTNASATDGKYMVTTMYPAPDTNSTLQITVTVDSQAQAQKVQDYLLTTGATGSVSPSPTFSEAKQKALQSQARDEATKDAKAKADQMAKNLGFKLGAVKTVEDANGFGGGIMPMSARDVTVESGSVSVGSAAGGAGTIAMSTDAAKPVAGVAKLSIMPGQDQVYYAVNVTYFVK